MVPVINVFKKDINKFKTIVAVTAQHREMLDQVLSLFEIIPDYDLNIMSPDQSLERLMSKILTGIADLLVKTTPDVVFVQGDTTTTFAASWLHFIRKYLWHILKPACAPEISIPLSRRKLTAE